MSSSSASPEFSIPDCCKRVKVDVGLSYNAPQAQSWLSADPDLYVIGVEPNPEAVQAILSPMNKKRAPFHDDVLSPEHLKGGGGRFQLVQAALGNRVDSKGVPFHVMSKDCGTSSLYAPRDPTLGPMAKQIRVPLITLAVLLKNFPWDRFPYIEYLKVDAQGSDLDVLIGAGTLLQERVVFVTAEPGGIQYHRAEHCNVNNIAAYMRSQEFQMINHPRTTDPTFVNRRFMALAQNIQISQV